MHDQALERRFHRRDVLRLLTVGSGATALLAACSTPAPAPAAPATPASASAPPPAAAASPVSSAVAPAASPAAAAASPVSSASPVTAASPVAAAAASSGSNQLKLAWNVSPPNFNPFNAVNTPQWDTFASVYSTLCMSDPQGQKYAPDLAETWDIAADGSSYTFHLRSNARWHDGQPVTAADVEFTYTMGLHPDTASNLAGFAAIKGAADFAAGKTDRVAGITVADDRTIRFDMETPNGIFMIQTVPGPAPFGIIPKHLLGDVKPADLAKHKLFTDSPVGSGPFKFVKYQPDQFVQLQANSDYHFGKPKIDGIVFNIAQSPDAMSVGMDRGDIDMPIFDGGSAPNDMFKKFVSDPKFKLVGVADGPVIGYGFNFRKDGLKDARLHQAWLYALDRKTLVEQFNLGNGSIVNSWMIHPWYQKPEWASMYGFNPDQARSLLKDMSWNTSQEIAVNVLPIADDNTRSWLAAEQQMLGDAGIQIKFNEMDTASWVAAFYNEPHTFDAVRVTFGAFPDPDGFLGFHLLGGSKNAFGYANPSLDSKIKAGQQQVNQSQRVAIYQDINQQMLTDLPVAPVVWQNTWLVQNRRFHIPQFDALTPATTLSNVPLAPRFLTGSDYFKYRMDQWSLS